jgi:hypothetical protein
LLGKSYIVYRRFGFKMVAVVYRIRSKDFSVCEVRGNSCKKSSLTHNSVPSKVGTKVPSSSGKFPEAVVVAKLFKKHGKLKLIVDGKDSKFLVGGFSEGKVVGGRVKFLPDGSELGKPYSLFAKGLKIHDEKSHSHWDVIFENPNGKFAYLYTLEKEKLSKKAKYKKVDDFEKCLPKLKRNLIKAVDSDTLVLPMLILLKTKMRIGSELYYLKNGHKGLTTLKKKDIKISGDIVSFEYIGKDGVPQKISEEFPVKVVQKLKVVLGKRKGRDFVFVDPKGHPLKDTAFEAAFEKYCGKRFYPHIVRSHYATKETEKFLKKKKASKEEVEKFCLKIAKKLGHKKFSKKHGWESSYKITLHYYVRPELVDKVEKLMD